ncbi:hypothetical protein JOE40_000707 [Arthrobacter sp. PvP102]|uniref:hypothetical protein n=1 Tax=unclassified Arthrobacter TaxID=235627 RepID=UPI001AE1D3F4|nr:MULTISPECIES: hypothetical protein [unclassified Arthrobacter]MBP1235239.1 hypothetical protein [Arthrobacter sp. PvP103]MBP1236198.1 hypothetical protein [Arthrobacter sp. PvP102]
MLLEHDHIMVSVRTRRELDTALDNAVDFLRPTATAEKVGISVTRLGFGRYVASLDRNVPPGTIMESWGTSAGSR